jgi:hypothetical protein
MRQLAKYTIVILTFAAACDQSSTAPAGLRPGDALFAKAATNATAKFYIANDASTLFQGDGVAAYLEASPSPFAGMSRYADGECGVTGTIFSAPGYSGDGNLQTQGSQDRRCAAFPRKVRVTFALINPDGTTSSDGAETTIAGINLHPLEQAAANGNPGLYIPVGTSQSRAMHLGDGTGGKCDDGSGSGGLAFRTFLNTGAYAGADDVVVFRNSADTWTVTSTPDETDPVTGQTIHHDKAYCRGNGKLYHMPVHYVIKSSAALVP